MEIYFLLKNQQIPLARQAFHISEPTTILQDQRRIRAPPLREGYLSAFSYDISFEPPELQDLFHNHEPSERAGIPSQPQSVKSTVSWKV